MAKDTFFFRHDYEPTTDPKIQAMLSEHGATGYGLFWRITEMLHSEALHKIPKKKYFYMAIAKQLDADVQHVEAFVKSCINLYELFDEDEEYFWSNRVIRNIEYKDSMSQKRSDAGKKSAELKQQRSTSVQQVLTSVQQNSTYNIKEDNIKGNKTIKDNSLLSEKRTAFTDQLQKFLNNPYSKELLNDFYKYWIEPNKSGTKLRFELERTWDLKTRLQRWSNNTKEFKKIEKEQQYKVTVKANML